MYEVPCCKLYRSCPGPLAWVWHIESSRLKHFLGISNHCCVHEPRYSNGARAWQSTCMKHRADCRHRCSWWDSSRRICPCTHVRGFILESQRWGQDLWFACRWTRAKSSISQAESVTYPIPSKVIEGQHSDVWLSHIIIQGITTCWLKQIWFHVRVNKCVLSNNYY